MINVNQNTIFNKLKKNNEKIKLGHILRLNTEFFFL